MNNKKGNQKVNQTLGDNNDLVSKDLDIELNNEEGDQEATQTIGSGNKTTSVNLKMWAVIGTIFAGLFGLGRWYFFYNSDKETPPTEDVILKDQQNIGETNYEYDLEEIDTTETQIE